MHKWRLLPHTSIQLEALQRPAGVLADIDKGISQSKQLVVSYKRAVTISYRHSTRVN